MRCFNRIWSTVVMSRKSSKITLCIMLWVTGKLDRYKMVFEIFQGCHVLCLSINFHILLCWCLSCVFSFPGWDKLALSFLFVKKRNNSLCLLLVKYYMIICQSIRFIILGLLVNTFNFFCGVIDNWCFGPNIHVGIVNWLLLFGNIYFKI